jgi:hypothetical protein
MPSDPTGAGDAAGDAAAFLVPLGRAVKAAGRLALGAYRAVKTWTASAKGLRIVEQVGDVVEIAGTVRGHEIRILANMSREGGTLFLKQTHIQGPGAGKVGVKGLMDAAREFGKSPGADKVIIEGAKRTTGAGHQRGAVPRDWEILVK